jgi:hypothetical protein
MRQHVMTYEQVHFRPIVHPRPYAV